MFRANFGGACGKTIFKRPGQEDCELKANLGYTLVHIHANRHTYIQVKIIILKKNKFLKIK